MGFPVFPRGAAHAASTPSGAGNTLVGGSVTQGGQDWQGGPGWLPWGVLTSKPPVPPLTTGALRGERGRKTATGAEWRGRGRDDYNARAAGGREYGPGRRARYSARVVQRGAAAHLDGDAGAAGAGGSDRHRPSTVPSGGIRAGAGRRPAAAGGHQSHQRIRRLAPRHGRLQTGGPGHDHQAGRAAAAQRTGRRAAEPGRGRAWQGWRCWRRRARSCWRRRCCGSAWAGCWWR